MFASDLLRSHASHSATETHWRHVWRVCGRVCSFSCSKCVFRFPVQRRGWGRRAWQVPELLGLLIGGNVSQACLGDVEHAGGWNANRSPLPRRVMALCWGFSQAMSPVQNPARWQGGCLKSLHMLRLPPERFLPKPTEPLEPFKQIVFGIGGRSWLCYCTLPPLPANKLGKSSYFLFILSRICPSCLFRTDQTGRACAALKQQLHKDNGNEALTQYYDCHWHPAGSVALGHPVALCTHLTFIPVRAVQWSCRGAFRPTGICWFLLVFRALA